MFFMWLTWSSSTSRFQTLQEPNTLVGWSDFPRALSWTTWALGAASGHAPLCWDTDYNGQRCPPDIAWPAPLNRGPKSWEQGRDAPVVLCQIFMQNVLYEILYQVMSIFCYMRIIGHQKHWNHLEKNWQIDRKQSLKKIALHQIV